MHATFVLLATALSFLAFVDLSLARLGQQEHLKALNALKNGPAKDGLAKRQNNNTYAPGQLCTEDGYLQGMQTLSAVAIPFCSSYISIANYTVTTAYSTVYTYAALP